MITFFGSAVQLRNYFPVVHGKKSAINSRSYSQFGSFLLLRFTCLPVLTHTQVTLTVTVTFLTSRSFHIQFSVPQVPFPIWQIASLSKVQVKTLSCARLFAALWTVAYQAPPAMGLSRWEYWGGVPSPGDLPNPGMQPGSPSLQADSAVGATRKSRLL